MLFSFSPRAIFDKLLLRGRWAAAKTAKGLAQLSEMKVPDSRLQTYTSLYSRTRSLSLGRGRLPDQGDVERLVKPTFSGLWVKTPLQTRVVFPHRCAGSGSSGMAERLSETQEGAHLSLVWRERMSVGAPRGRHRVALCSLDNLAATSGEKIGGSAWIDVFIIKHRTD